MVSPTSRINSLRFNVVRKALRVTDPTGGPELAKRGLPSISGVVSPLSSNRGPEVK